MNNPERLLEILFKYKLPQPASADAEGIIQETIEYAKKRNPGAAVLVCSRTLAEAMSRYTLAQGNAEFSIPEASQLLDAIIKYYFSTIYKAPKQALEAASTEECVQTLLRLENSAAQYKEDTDAIGLRIFPARELRLFMHIGNNEQKVEDCKRKWIQCGGGLYGGKMIALTMDSIWEKMSIFQLPYPPFDFRCCFGTLGVPRKDCISIGLIKEPKHLILKRKLPAIRLSIKAK